MPVSPDAANAPTGEVAAIILAAGKSTRMRSKLPKPLHRICGFPLTDHVIRACLDAGIKRIVVIVGHEAETVKAGLMPGVEFAIQEQPRGTGHAVISAEPLFRDWHGTILVLAGDIPLIRSRTLGRLVEHQRSSNAAATMLTAQSEDPTGYGRILRDEQGLVAGIVEHRDATDEQRALTEWNPSIYAFDAGALWPALREVSPSNAQSEFYLTDTIGILRRGGRAVESVPAEHENDVMGVNNLVELAAAGAVLRQRILEEHMLAGVCITDPAATYIDAGVEIGADTRVEPNTFLYSGTKIGSDCTIGPMARIDRTTIGDRCKIWASQVVDAVIASDVSVGPFANLRPGTILSDKVKIGDFVEVKNAVFGLGAQASHLSYIGDADVGERTNIGAGTVTCNYDGYRKHRTKIGSNAFIGSHSTLIAPVEVGAGAFIAAGSAVTVNVPPDAMAIGRSRTTIKEGWAASYREGMADGGSAAKSMADKESPA